MSKPKIVKKCFRVSTAEGSSTVYAKSPSQARYFAFIESGYGEFCFFKEVLNKFSVRRDPAKDLIECVPHIKASELSEQQIKEMGHAIGHDYFKEPYRNRYVVEHSDSWEDLISKGMAEKSKAFGTQNYYWVTYLGIEVITSLQPIPRYLLDIPLKSLLEGAKICLK